MPKQIDTELKSIVELVNQQMIFGFLVKKMVFRSFAVNSKPSDLGRAAEI